MNHRRANAPVGHCPQCGGVVNDSVRAAPCSEAQHATARLRHTVFCVNCGVQLIFAR
jgi:ribosomal protein S27AE